MISIIPAGIGVGAALLTLTYSIIAKLQKQIESELAERGSSNGFKSVGAGLPRDPHETDRGVKPLLQGKLIRSVRP